MYRIFELMAEHNITQYKLANELAMPTSIFTNWKNGTAKPSLDALTKIANYFGVSLDYLVGRDAPIKPKPLPNGLQYIHDNWNDISPTAQTIAVSVVESAVNLNKKETPKKVEVSHTKV